MEEFFRFYASNQEVITQIAHVICVLLIIGSTSYIAYGFAKAFVWCVRDGIKDIIKYYKKRKISRNKKVRE